MSLKQAFHRIAGALVLKNPALIFGGNHACIEIGFIKEDSRELWWEGRVDTETQSVLE